MVEAPKSRAAKRLMRRKTCWQKHLLYHRDILISYRPLHKIRSVHFDQGPAHAQVRAWPCLKTHVDEVLFTTCWPIDPFAVVDSLLNDIAIQNALLQSCDFEFCSLLSSSSVNDQKDIANSCSLGPSSSEDRIHNSTQADDVHELTSADKMEDADVQGFNVSQEMFVNVESVSLNMSDIVAVRDLRLSPQLNGEIGTIIEFSKKSSFCKVLIFERALGVVLPLRKLESIWDGELQDLKSGVQLNGAYVFVDQYDKVTKRIVVELAETGQHISINPANFKACVSQFRFGNGRSSACAYWCRISRYSLKIRLLYWRRRR